LFIPYIKVVVQLNRLKIYILLVLIRGLLLTNGSVVKDTFRDGVTTSFPSYDRLNERGNEM